MIIYGIHLFLLDLDTFPVRTASRSFASWPKLDAFPDERRNGRQVIIRFVKFHSNTLGTICSDPLIYPYFCYYSLVLTTLPYYKHAHPFQVSLPNPRTLAHKSSFIPRTCKTSSSFPELYNLSVFKSNIKKLDLISLST